MYVAMQAHSCMRSCSTVLFSNGRPAPLLSLQFGILLYEVLTSERPYAKVPHAMLGHVR